MRCAAKALICLGSSRNWWPCPSTGVIGEYLNMESITKGISLLAETEPAEGDFEEAILTTDTVIKQTCYELMIGGQRVTIGGAAKGSGMIHPNMATMLGLSQQMHASKKARCKGH
jgi:N-acetylglutamate synthase/N-acetylornithine aminotransferase